MAKKQTQLIKTTVLPPEPPKLKEWDGVRSTIAIIQRLGQCLGLQMILLGHKLNQLKASQGVKHGGDHKSSLHRANLGIPWEELVAQQTGYSYATCHRAMQLAAGAKKHIPLLTAKDVAEKDFGKLPLARQNEVVKTLSKAVDGCTLAELMFEFGIWKAKNKNTPPRRVPALENGGGGDVTTDPAALRQLALENGNRLRDMHQNRSWEYLNDDELTTLDAMLDGWKQDTATLLKQRLAKTGGGRGK